MKILVLDFNEDFYPIYRRKLEGIEGVEVYFAKSYVEASSIISSKDVMCVMINHLFDDTFRMYDKIRNMGFNGKIVICIAGKEKYVKRNKYNGIVGVIDKSLNGEDFRSKLVSLIQDVSVKDTQGQL